MPPERSLAASRSQPEAPTVSGSPQAIIGLPLLALGLLLVAVTGCAAAPEPAPRVPTGWALWGKAQVAQGKSGMVVSGHPLASEVGIRILRQGGNAIDAAVAVGFALAAVLPEAGNIGGGGFLVYRDVRGEVLSLDYRETAPAAANRDMYLDADGNLTDGSITGHLAVAVPGSVAGLWEMHGRFGILPWEELLEPAVELAEEHLVDEIRSQHLAAAAERLRRFPTSATSFLPNGEAPAAGAAWHQPELASTLRQIAREGAQAFYSGDIAALIVSEMERGGGLVTAEDLGEYRPVWRQPIELSYRGYTIYSMPPPSSGGVTLAQILNILEGFETLPAFGSARLVHLESEAMRRAFIDRNRYLGDPGFVDMPLRRLLSSDYAASLRSEIDPLRAGSTPAFTEPLREGTETTHYSIVDGYGNAAAVTTTINSSFGSAVTVEGAGFLLNNEMDDFAAAPGKPNQFGLVQGEANSISPGKRMLSSMTPSVVLDPQGELYLVLGSPGGSKIISSVYHVISNLIDHGMSPEEAVEAPRVHHQAWPDRIEFEVGGLDDDVLTRLEATGHAIYQLENFSGDITALARGEAGWLGVADPRRGAGAAGY